MINYANMIDDEIVNLGWMQIGVQPRLRGNGRRAAIRDIRHDDSIAAYRAANPVRCKVKAATVVKYRSAALKLAV